MSHLINLRDGDVEMTKDEAIQLVLNKESQAIGAKSMSFIDCLPGHVFDDLFLDLAGQDYNPNLADGELVMELWFAESKTGSIPAEAVLDTREENRPYGREVINKLRVKVELDRVYIDGRRIYIES